MSSRRMHASPEQYQTLVKLPCLQYFKILSLLHVTDMR